MRKSLSVLITVISLFILTIDVHADSSQIDLPINIKGIKERDYRIVALTDAYDINILTKECSKAQNIFKVAKEQKRNELCTQLQFNFMGINKNVNKQYMEMEDLKIFVAACNYEKNDSTKIKENKYTFILKIVIFIILAILSFLLALAIQRMKRRKNNVYNSNFGNGK